MPDAPGPVAIQYRDQIIASICDGKRLTDIAPDLGVTPQAISKVLKSDPEYQSAIEVGLHVKLDRREAELEAAVEQVDVTRARELLSHSRWKAERECPQRWGAKQQITLDARSTVEVVLSDDAMSLLDSLRTVASIPIDAPHTELLPAPTGSGDT